MGRVGLKQLRPDGAKEDYLIRFNESTDSWEPVSPNTVLHRLIITTWGGIVYDSDGELVLKED